MSAELPECFFARVEMHIITTTKLDLCQTGHIWPQKGYMKLKRIVMLSKIDNFDPEYGCK